MREPVVSNKFYPGDQDDLRNEVSRTLVDVKDKIQAKGIILPHAGYMYSGSVAGKVLSHIKPVDTYIIIGPNHTGYGSDVSVSGQSFWNTPLGDVAVDEGLKKILFELSDSFKEDDEAHKFEHSIEVQLPFLQVLGEDFKFLPIVVGSLSKNTYKDLAGFISDAIIRLGKDIVIIASSDMTHYEPCDIARLKDHKVIDKMLNIDSEAVFDIVKKNMISMCGVLPVSIMLESCKRLGAKNAKLIEYKTSADISDDTSSVVGYAGVVIS